MAHRGASGRYAENTRAAFLHAAALGADLIETDVHLTADGAVVCTHAPTVQMPGSETPIPVAELSLAQLRDLDFHTWMGATIPAEYGTPADQFMTLPELLALLGELPAAPGLLIEMKEPYPFGRLLEQRVLEALEAAHWDPETSTVPGTGGGIEVTFLSFDPDSIGYLLDSGVQPGRVMAVISPRRSDNTGLIDAGTVGIAAVKWDWVLQSHDHAAQTRQWAHSGTRLNVWTLNDPDGILQAAAFGADYLTTDYPDMARQCLNPLVTTGS